VLEIHRVLLQRFGGPEGVRDPGLLESALYRSRTGYHVDLAEMAAALFESLIMNHPFVDGNKPVAFFATNVFLRLNGYKLKVAANQAHRFLIGLLESDRCSFDELLPWIRTHAVKL
jgi:death-on-curing protein